jgi:hypothetical protein
MQISAWAEDHSRRLLSPLGHRWRHARMVAQAARQLTIGLAPEDAEVLIAAAYLHDVGYARELAFTGFHPLDGARHLRGIGLERLAGLVAHHTQGRHEAKLRGLQEALAEFDDEDSLVSAALAYCDLTTGPSGERMTPRQRLLDVNARYGDDSPVTTGLRAAWPDLMDSVDLVKELRTPPTESVVAQPR